MDFKGEGQSSNFFSLFTYILRCGRSQMIRSPQLWFHGLKTGEWWHPWRSWRASFFSLSSVLSRTWLSFPLQRSSKHSKKRKKSFLGRSIEASNAMKILKKNNISFIRTKHVTLNHTLCGLNRMSNFVFNHNNFSLWWKW